MNQTAKTILYAAAAVVLGVLAYVAVPSSRPPEVFSDEGQPFYAPFDPLDVASVEVVSYNRDKAEARVFKVALTDGKWTIPSHQNYAADAKEQLGRTAAVLNGLKRGALRSDRETDFAACGLVDPLDEKRLSPDGRGKRVTLKDKQGKALCDLIIGDAVKDRSGAYYVRMPGKNRSYACSVDAGNISTRFADWVETSLLKVTASGLREMTLDNYRVNRDTQAMVPGEVLDFKRDKDDSTKWNMEGVAANEELDKDKVRAMTDILASLTLVGVRHKPAGLLQALKNYAQGKKTTREELAKLADLANIGYSMLLSEKGEIRVVSNQGEIRAGSDEGIRYTLRFGEVLYGEADDVSGTDVEKKKIGGAKEADKEKKDEAKGAEHRYLFVSAAFDPALLGAKPEAPAEPKKPEILEKKEAADKAAKDEKKPEAPAADKKPDATAGKDEAAKPAEAKDAANPEEKTEADKIAEAEKAFKKATEEYERAKKDFEQKQKDYDKKVEDGRKKAQELEARFSEWYYVISADAYGKLNLARKDLVKEKKEEKKDEAKAAEAAKPEQPAPAPAK